MVTILAAIAMIALAAAHYASDGCQGDQAALGDW